MRTLFFHLALVDCWEASWRLAAGDVPSAARCLVQAGRYLDNWALHRDSEDAWRPVLGAADPA